jgi:hypothetical protein
MSSALEIVEPQALAPAPPSGVLVTPMMMLNTAVERGADIATIERLAALAERMETQRARRDFDEALASAKAEIPTIRKNREVDFTSAKGRTNYRHEDLAEIARVVSPILARHGLSYRFRSGVENGMVLVTCIISHRGGHSEENTLIAGRDESGNKNNIQAVGSTITYLQRYTLKAALGLAASEDDDAGTHGGGDTITDDQADDIEALILNTGGEISAFLQFKRLASLSDIKAKDFDATRNEIKRIAAKRAEKRNG